MTYALGTKSETQLVGVHPNMKACVRLAISFSTLDFRVGEGVRSGLRQAWLYSQGRTRPGKVVTWVRVSNHQAKADGYGYAVDLWVLNTDGSIDWNSDGKSNWKYDEIYRCMFKAAAELGITLRSGMDWDRDGIKREHGETDQPHYELVK